MKNKTLLKFLLCFLIIGSGLNLAKVDAATGSSEEVYTEVCQSCSGRVTNRMCSSGNSVMKYDGKNYHYTDKWICPTCLAVINSAYHDYCGSIGWMTIKIGTCVCGGDIITDGSRIRCTKGSLTTPKKDGDKYVCGSVTQCSAEGCDGYIVDGKCSTGKLVGTYNRRTYHYSNKYMCTLCEPAKVVDGWSCGQHPTSQALEIGRCECGGKVIAANDKAVCLYSNTEVNRESGKYKCKRAVLNENPGWTVVRTLSNNNGTHMVTLKNAVGETKTETENCDISVNGNYVSNGNGTHSVTTRCSKCNWENKVKYCENCEKEFSLDEVKCKECNKRLKPKAFERTYNCSKDSKSVSKLDDSKHTTTYKCNACKGTWTEVEYHTWEFVTNSRGNKVSDGKGGWKQKCRFCTATPSEIDVPSSGGPSAINFFNKGSAKADKQIKDMFESDSDNNSSELMSPVNHILGLVMMVGTYAGVIIMAVYAIAWMTATPAKRQDLKAGMIPLTLGIILLMVGPRLALLIVEALL